MTTVRYERIRQLQPEWVPHPACQYDAGHDRSLRPELTGRQRFFESHRLPPVALCPMPRRPSKITRDLFRPGGVAPHLPAAMLHKPAVIPARWSDDPQGVAPPPCRPSSWPGPREPDTSSPRGSRACRNAPAPAPIPAAPAPRTTVAMPSSLSAATVAIVPPGSSHEAR